MLVSSVVCSGVCAALRAVLCVLCSQGSTQVTSSTECLSGAAVLSCVKLAETHVGSSSDQAALATLNSNGASTWFSGESKIGLASPPHSAPRRGRQKGLACTGQTQINLNHLSVSVLEYSSVERVCSTRVAISGRTVYLAELTLHITVHDGMHYTHVCFLALRHQDPSEEVGCVAGRVVLSASARQ